MEVRHSPVGLWALPLKEPDYWLLVILWESQVWTWPVSIVLASIYNKGSFKVDPIIVVVLLSPGGIDKFCFSMMASKPSVPVTSSSFVIWQKYSNLRKIPLNLPVYDRCTNGLERHQTGVVEARGRMEWLAGLYPPSPESTAPGMRMGGSLALGQSLPPAVFSFLSPY